MNTKFSTFLILLLTLGGCGFRYDHEDQLASMAPYGHIEIQLPASETVAEPKSLPPNKFLVANSGAIWGASSWKSPPTVSLEKKGDDSFITLSWKDGEINLEATSFYCGMAAPVSDDGYFITANHVLATEFSMLAYMANDIGEPSISSSEIRVVYADKATDFAVIKVDFPTPNFLRIRRSSLMHDEVLFAKSWSHMCAAGNYTGSESISRKTNDAHILYNKIQTTIPVLAGDSGAPLIDSKGKLCGIICNTRLGRWLKKKRPKSYATMIDEKALFRIIEEDRATNGSPAKDGQ